MCRVIAWPSAISFHVFQIGGAQNLAIVVSSGVRVALVSCPKVLDLRDGLSPSGGRERGRGDRAELVAAVQDEGRDGSPVGEHGCGLIGGRDLVVARLQRRRDEWWGRDGGAVVLPDRQHAGCSGLSHADSLLRVWAGGQGCELLREELVEGRLPGGVQREEGVMCRLVCGGVRTRVAVGLDLEHVGPIGVGDRHDRVVDGGVHDCVAPRRVDRRRLRSRRVQNGQELLVPIDDVLAGPEAERNASHDGGSGRFRCRPSKCRRGAAYYDTETDQCGDCSGQVLHAVRLLARASVRATFRLVWEIVARVTAHA